MSMLVHRALGVEQSVETPYAESRWVAMKFGGKSVSTAENWRNIAGLLRDRRGGFRSVRLPAAAVDQHDRCLRRSSGLEDDRLGDLAGRLRRDRDRGPERDGGDDLRSHPA